MRHWATCLTAMRHWDTCLTLVIQLNVTLLFNGVTSHETLGNMSDTAMRHWVMCLTLVIQPNVTLVLNGTTSREALGHVPESCDTTKCHFALQWRHQP